MMASSNFFAVACSRACVCVMCVFTCISHLLFFLIPSKLWDNVVVLFGGSDGDRTLNDLYELNLGKINHHLLV